MHIEGLRRQKTSVMDLNTELKEDLATGNGLLMIIINIIIINIIIINMSISCVQCTCTFIDLF